MCILKRNHSTALAEPILAWFLAPSSRRKQSTRILDFLQATAIAIEKKPVTLFPSFLP